MKKIVLIIPFLLVTLLFCGCQLNNTPTKKVEAYLNNYKTLDEKVIDQLDKIVAADTIMTAKQKEEYKEILKRQYKNMSYTIKDEVIDGDTATVTVEIEVYDFYKLTKESDLYYATLPEELKDDSGTLSQSKYIDYKLLKMKNYMEKVKYTMDFTLKKIDKTWTLDEINEETRQKIHGLYAY